MKKSPLLIRGLVAAGVIAALAVLRYKPWQPTAQASAREHLTVGFLPVT
jgi:hypothetical protein